MKPSASNIAAPIHSKMKGLLSLSSMNGPPFCQKGGSYLIMDKLNMGGRPNMKEFGRALALSHVKEKLTALRFEHPWTSAIMRSPRWCKLKPSLIAPLFWKCRYEIWADMTADAVRN